MSRFMMAWWSFMGPTVPRPRMLPPPSGLMPTQPYFSGNGPSTRVYHGFFSTMFVEPIRSR